MEKRQLGNTDMQITRIGYGAWAIGGGQWEFGWGPQDDRESIAAIHRALEYGVNWIDTAAAYGLGRSERVVAEALKSVTNKPYVFTKCSITWDDSTRQIDHSLKAASVRREVEDSLKRLNVDAIDLYQIHWPNPDEEMEEGWQTLAQLKEEGKVRHIGVSNFDVAQLERARAIAPVSSLQPPYSLVKPEVAEEILPYCLENNIGVIVYSPMYSGMLTGAMTRERIAAFPDDDWRKTDDEFVEPRLTRNLALADLLVEIGKKHGRTAGEIAVAWTLRNPAVTGAIVGARRPGQVDGFIGAAEFSIPEEDLQQLDAFLAQ